mgnify:CR=1 FL=1
MNTQLILYPQNFSGYSYTTSPIITQYLAAFQFNVALNATYTLGAGSVGSAPPAAYQILFSGQSPIVGAWKGFHSVTGYYNATSAPSANAGTLTLTGGSGTPSLVSASGAYQRITGLSSGQLYTITLISTGGAGILQFGGLNAALYNLSNTSNPIIHSNTAYGVSGATNITHSFTATSSSAILSVLYLATTDTDLEISSISLTENPNNAPLAYSELSDGQVICDLYEEENIPLTLSVDDFKNIAEKVQSYSKDFDLPNTKRNNRIFTHIFDITKTIATASDFNPFARTRAVLKQDGIVIFEGSLRLIEIKNNEGEISYNVNLYSETIALAEVLQDRTFADLDFAELEHTYDKLSIKNSWDNTIGLPLTNPLPAGTFAGTVGASVTNVLKYPWVNWKGDMLIASGVSGNNATIGMPELKALQHAFRPFIQLKYLLDNIFNSAGYQYTSTFLNTADFKKLFMDFNWGKGQNPELNNQILFAMAWYASYTAHYAGTSYSNLKLAAAYSGAIVDPDYDLTTNIITASNNGTQYDIDYSYTIENTDSVTRTVEFQWLFNAIQLEYSGVITLTAGATYTYQGTFSQLLNATDTLQAQFKADSASVVWERTAWTSITRSSLNITSAVILNTLRGETNQWEFLKGIMTMFNLITIADPQNPNRILIEPYNDIFGLSPTVVTPTTRYWTDKIDVKEIALKPLELTRNILLKYEKDDDDYAFNVYKNASTGYLYGSKEVDGSNIMPGTNQVTNMIGEEEIVASPFAATVCKPLDNTFPNFITPAIYSSNEDNTEFEGFDNMPRILYDNGIVTLDAGASYYIPAQGTQSSENQTQFLQFSHLSAIQPTNTDIDYNFGSCQLIGINTAPPDNLYYTYYSEYFNHLYNPNTRVMTIKVNLNATDINTFKFYDKVFIKNREFRVNRIDYKPNELSTVEFILLN